MGKLEQDIRILLVDDRQADVDMLKRHLHKYMRLPWNLVHCVNLTEAKQRIGSVDLIILELELEGLSSPEQIFGEMDDKAFEVPIIALTAKNKSGHGMATYVMEKGAADTIIRGQFGRLVDAIEFALIRQRISTENRKSNDKLAADNNQQNVQEKEKSRQTLRMFMGDYSVDSEQNK